MKFTQEKIKGVYVIEPEPREDERGYFARVFAKEELRKVGVDFSIVHINRSLSKEKGVIRGIHYQNPPHQEDKIIQCLQGDIFDVALDLRTDSETYGQWFGEILNRENKKMILIPKGCAHGFQTLKEDTVVEYFVSQYYSPSDERGVRWDDPSFSINWPIKKAILSEKDQKWPSFEL